MPLLILTVPKQTGVNAEALAGTCNRILDEVVGVAANKDEGIEEKEGILGIPDKTDRELRIMVSEAVDKPTVVLSFTIGPNEYPKFEPQAFFPTETKIIEAGQKIKQLAEKAGLQGVGVSLEAWEDTTFELREKEPKELQPHGLTAEAIAEIGKRIKEPRIRVVLSQDMIEAGGGKETEQGRQIEFYNQVTQEMAKIMGETLGIPAQTKLRTEVLVADKADSDISVEFDCQPEGSLIPRELREYGAGRLEQLLNEKLPAGEAEVWLRQGQPEVTTIF